MEADGQLSWRACGAEPPSGEKHIYMFLESLTEGKFEKVVWEVFECILKCYNSTELSKISVVSMKTHFSGSEHIPSPIRALYRDPYFISHLL